MSPKNTEDNISSHPHFPTKSIFPDVPKAESPPEEIDRFYRRTQILPVDLRDELVKVGRVIIADLGLRNKVQALRDGAL